MEITTRKFYRTAVLATAAAFGGFVSPAMASDVSGTVSFTGNVVFASPIAGIDADDLTVSSGPGIEATGNGENCSFTANASAPVALDGTYPEVGTLTVGIQITRGGPQAPDGTCKVQLRASGTDGASVSAQGTVTVEVTLADITGNATVAASTITVRASKTEAGLDVDCLKWVKKQVKLRGKCNASLWKLGATDGALKCKTADVEPANCDPYNYVESVLALSFGQMDQQDDMPSAKSINLEDLAEQAKCQRYIGKSAANYFARRNQFVQKRCVAELLDTEACRAQAGVDSRSKLDNIDNCFTTQGTDLLSGLTLADVDEPCRADCISAGTIDRKCLKSCFELELSTLSDGVIGDVPQCGNGVVQDGEACDDGNVDNGDCCSSVCGFEPVGTQSCGVGACEVTDAPKCSMGELLTCTPGPAGVEAGQCADVIDNDCDGLVDAADIVDCP